MSTDSITTEMNVQIVQKEGSIQFQNYEQLKANVNNTLKKYAGLKLTEDNKQEIKKKRAELNSTAKLLNSERISAKAKFLKPFEMIETQIKELTTLIYDVSAKLDTQVKAQETAEKQAKENALKTYFETYLDAIPTLSFLKFEDIGLNITLSASNSKLEKQIDEYVANVVSDLEEIESSEHKTRLLAKYELTKNLEQSKLSLDAELENENRPKPQDEVFDRLVNKRETFNSVQSENISKLTVLLKVHCTSNELLALEQFMKTNKINYSKS